MFHFALVSDREAPGLFANGDWRPADIIPQGMASPRGRRIQA